MTAMAEKAAAAYKAPANASVVSVVQPAPPEPIAFGGYALDIASPWNQSTATGWITRYGRKPAIIHQFVPIVDTTTPPSSERTNRALFSSSLAWANDALAQGAVPLFTHELRDHRIAQRTVQPQYTLDQWLAGANDAPLIAWMQAAGAWGKRFLYRFGWEMTGYDYTWALGFPGNTPTKYINFWQYIVGKLRTYAPLGEPVWCPSVLLPPNAALFDMSLAWPGDSWVTWAGLDGYITGNVGASGPNRSFADLMGPSAATIQAITQKRIIVCETGVNPAIAGSYSTDWLLALPSDVKTLPSVRGVVLFDNQTSIVHNEPQLDAIRTIVQASMLQGSI